jgi:hypothetical protein
MGVKPLNSANLGAFVARVGALREDSKRRWGSLRPAAMHLNITTELSLGDIHAEDRSNMFSRLIGGRLVYHALFPWPKGKIKVPPEYTPETNHSVDEERTRLVAMLTRFVETAEREPQRKTRHPMFGLFTLKYWQHVHGKHINHHLDQFGV